MAGKRPLNMSPKKKVNRKKKKVEVNKPQPVIDGLRSVRSRATPSLLVEKIGEMNSNQRKAVVDLGFGSLLDLKIREVPQKLAFFVLSNFDCDSCDIVLPLGNRRLHVDENDVHLTLGLPKGVNSIVASRSSQDIEFISEWRNLASNGNPSRIVASDVANAMIQEASGGEWFQRHFLVLMVACLIEHTSTGYINCKVFDTFNDLGSVKDINWCGYVIDVLQSRTKKWQSNPSNQYLGPILFLVGFYIDRVVMDVRSAVRTFPTLIGWDQELIRKRQSTEAGVGTFGTGYICDRFVPPVINLSPVCEPVIAAHNDPDNPGTSNSVNDDITNQRSCVFRAAKKMSDAMLEYMELVQGCQKVVFEDEGIMKLIEATQMIVGSGFANTVNDLASGKPCNVQSTQIFWDDPKNYETLCEMEAAVQMSIEYKKFVADIPSYSIGLTQMENNWSIPVVDNEMPSAETPSNSKVFLGEATAVSGLNSKSQLDDHLVAPDKSKMEMLANETPSAKTPSTFKAFLGEAAAISGLNSKSHHACKVGAPVQSEMDMLAMARSKELRTKHSLDKGKSILNTTSDNLIPLKDLTRIVALELLSHKGAKEQDRAANVDELCLNDADIKGKAKDRASTVDELCLNDADIKGKAKDRSATVDDLSLNDAAIKGKAKAELMPVKRSTRGQKKPVIFASPFMVRVADPSQKLSKEEKEVYCWLFHNFDADKFQIVFRSGRMGITRVDMRTLAPTINICPYVIDIWSNVLNSREVLRAPTSPYRFFASTAPGVPTNLAAKYPNNFTVNESKFKAFLDLDLERFGNVEISKIQVFFFPFHVNSTYFVVCINLLKSKIEIIDSTDAYDENPSVDDTYAKIPSTLRSYFSQFLLSHGFKAKGASAAKFGIKLLRMPWRDSKNVTDVGVFVMRHMETYMGEGQDRWEVGLRKGWKKQLNYLRARYAYAILLSDLNETRIDIKTVSAAYFKQFTKKVAFDFERAILRTDYTVGL